MLKEVLQGKVIQARDPSSLLDFYAKLLSVYTLAEETGRAADFETPTTIDSILKRKVPFLADKWCKKAVKHYSLHDVELTFKEFLDFINDERALSERYNRAMGAANANQGTAKLPGAKIAATSAATSKSGGSPTPTGGCPTCSANHHLSTCDVFQKATPEEKRKTCFSARICYKCLEQGHVAKFCKSDKRCEKCLRQHLTMMHEVNAPAAIQPVAPPAAPTTTA